MMRTSWIAHGKLKSWPNEPGMKVISDATSLLRTLAPAAILPTARGCAPANTDPYLSCNN